MKKYSYILMVMLLALLTIGFTACSDDDEPKGADIVGTWQHDHPHNGSRDWDIYYLFTKDGIFLYVWESYMIEHYTFVPVVVVYRGTYTVSGTKLIVTLDSEPSIDLYLFPSECEFSVQDDSLKLLLGGEEPTFTRVDDSAVQPYL